MTSVQARDLYLGCTILPALAKLSEKQRHAVTGREFRNLSFPQLAAEMGVTAANAKATHYNMGDLSGFFCYCDTYITVGGGHDPQRSDERPAASKTLLARLSSSPTACEWPGEPSGPLPFCPSYVLSRDTSLGRHRDELLAEIAA